MARKKTESVGRYLKDCREARGLTQKEVAQALGLTSAQYISNCERGLCLPSLPMLVKLKSILGLDIKKTIDLYVGTTKGRLTDAFTRKAKKKP